MFNHKLSIVKTIFATCLFFLANVAMAQTPDIFKASNIKSNMLKVSDWQFKHSNGKPENTWTNAAFYTGVVAAYETTKSKVLLDSLTVSYTHLTLPTKRIV